MRAVDSFTFDPQRYRALAMPALLLTGSESAPFMREATAALARALPDARLVELAGQGHLAMDLAPELFLREGTRFLTAD